jgi:phosphopantetheinyl transferase (holo-ACP synthase)
MIFGGMLDDHWPRSVRHRTDPAFARRFGDAYLEQAYKKDEQALRGEDEDETPFSLSAKEACAKASRTEIANGISWRDARFSEGA